MDSPKGRTDGLNGDTMGCGWPNYTTRLQLVLDMTHKSSEIEICLLGDNLTKKRKVFYKEQIDKLNKKGKKFVLFRGS